MDARSIAGKKAAASDGVGRLQDRTGVGDDTVHLDPRDSERKSRGTTIRLLVARWVRCACRPRRKEGKRAGSDAV
uniref:Uncharacterized protein n=1 Tax=Oryza glumipatula TaxID=40148 RepID=A0A0E0B852_9ORYZ